MQPKDRPPRPAMSTGLPGESIESQEQEHAERRLLGFILAGRPPAEVFTRLRPNLFTFPAHRRLAKLLHARWKGGLPTDLPAVSDSLMQADADGVVDGFGGWDGLSALLSPDALMTTPTLDAAIATVKRGALALDIRKTMHRLDAALQEGSQERQDALKRRLQRLLNLAGAPAGAGAVVKPFEEIKPETVSWLWEPYVPAGKVTLFQGDPAAGKTWMALELCARLSREGVRSIYASLEDGAADTLRPRLDRLGADVSRVYCLSGHRSEDGSERSLTLDDVADLEQAVEAVNPALLVLDPISGWLQHADANKANEVRGKLTPVVRLAERTGVAVLIVQHLTKGRADRPIYRGQGSIDLVAGARSVVLLGADQGGQRAMVQIKSSLGPIGPSLSYSLGEEGFTWTGVSSLTAADILEPDAGPEERSELTEAACWLETVLSEGPQEAGEIIRAGEKAQHHQRTLRRALASLGGQKRREGFGRGSRVVWSLPNPPGQNGALTIGDNIAAIGARDTNVVPYGESTSPKGLQGGGSTIGDKVLVPVPYGAGSVPYGESPTQPGQNGAASPFSAKEPAPTPRKPFSALDAFLEV